MMGTKIVTTFGGEKVPAKYCRYILGEYYIKNKECFYIEGTWYRINSPNLYKDYETGNFITKKAFNNDSNKKYAEGIVEIKKGELVTGFFTINKRKNIKLYDNTFGMINCLSEEVIKPLNCIIHNGIYVQEKNLGDLLRRSEINLNNIKRNLPYRASEVLFNFLEEYNSPNRRTFSNPKYNIPLFNNIKYTFGIEIETESGVIPENKCFDLGLMPLRDGSIHGIEYATIPLSGKEGIESIYKIYETVNKFTTITSNNSVHIHLGGYPRNKEAITALYTLLFQLQDEMYSYFPEGYKNTANFKQRDYCSPLPVIKAGRGSFEVKLDTRFNSLYEWISGGDIFQNFSLKEHPADNMGQHKWNIQQRYRWVNLISLLFGSRGTVEFRIHNPTIDPNKVVNWLLICNAILQYAENNIEEIINSSLTSSRSVFDIIKQTYPKEITNYLIGYLGWKHKKHAEEFSNGDTVGKTSLKEEYVGELIHTNLF